MLFIHSKSQPNFSNEEKKMKSIHFPFISTLITDSQ